MVDANGNDACSDSTQDTHKRGVQLKNVPMSMRAIECAYGKKREITISS